MVTLKEVLNQTLLAHWILSNKVNIQDFHLAYWMSHAGTIELQIPNTFVLGDKRWARFGLI
jgi:hypothetical protein